MEVDLENHNLNEINSDEESEDDVAEVQAIDDAKLIERIRNALPLWFLKSSLDKDVPYKEGIWKNFEAEFGVEAKVLQRRFTNLKKSYKREKAQRKKELSKSGGPGPVKKRKRSGFAHFEAMSFLEANNKNKKNYTNVKQKKAISSKNSDQNSYNESNPIKDSVTGIDTLDIGAINQSSLNNDPMEISEQEEENLQSLLDIGGFGDDCSSEPEFNKEKSDGVPAECILTVKQASNSKKTGKENIRPHPLDTTTLPSPFIFPLAGTNHPKSCYNKSLQPKKDELVETVKTLRDVVVQSYQEEKETRKKDSQSEIPLEDELFGKTIAAELAEIEDKTVKKIKKKMIMNTLYAPIPDPKTTPNIAASNLTNATIGELPLPIAANPSA